MTVYFSPTAFVAGASATAATVNTQLTAVQTGFDTVDANISALEAAVVALGGVPGSVDVPTATASQSETEAGVEVGLRYMSPLLVAQAIAVIGEPETTLVSLGITATAAELNILDGVTADKNEINGVDGLTASRAVVTTAGGILTTSAATAAEVGYVSGVTSAVQTQLDAKLSSISGGASTIVPSDLTPSMALVSDGSGKVAVSSNVDTTELDYLAGVTSDIQTQLDDKLRLHAAGIVSLDTTSPTIIRGYNLASASALGTGRAYVYFDSPAASISLVCICTVYGTTSVRFAYSAGLSDDRVGIILYDSSLSLVNGQVSFAIYGPN